MVKVISSADFTMHNDTSIFHFMCQTEFLFWKVDLPSVKSKCYLLPVFFQDYCVVFILEKSLWKRKAKKRNHY